jgi:hypothetical protein
MPLIQGRSIATTITQHYLSSSIVQEIPSIRTTRTVNFCSRSARIEKIDEFHESRRRSHEVADSFCWYGILSEGIAVRGHEDADVSSAATADVEAREVGARFWVIDSVPGLFGDDAAWTGAGTRWWAGHLV